MREQSYKCLAPYIIGAGAVAGGATIFGGNAIIFAGNKDITQEFCKKTQTEEKSCQELKVFKEDTGNKNYYVTLEDPKTKEVIGSVAYGISEDGNLKIGLLVVDDKFQKMGYGSKLLNYALSQCGENCQYAVLLASPLDARSHEEGPTKFKNLQRFYAKHGGQVLSEEGGPVGQPTVGTMYFSDKL